MAHYEDNPLYQALVYNDYEAINALLASENAKELVHNFPPKNNALHYISEYGYSEFILPIIKLGIDPNIRNNEKQAPLHISIIQNHINVARELIKYGANTELRGKRLNTPLPLTAIYGRHDFVRILISNGANIEAMYYGQTPLHQSVKNETIGAMRELLAHGANIEAINFEGNTPLHIAASASSSIYVTELLAHGANIEAIDHAGNTPLHKAIISRNVDIVRVLLAHGANIDAINVEGNTPLHMAASASSSIYVTELLAHGANIEALDHAGNTPLHKAIISRNVDIVRVLLAHDVDIDAINVEGNTPLHIAASVSPSIYVTELLAHGANIEAINHAGNTPLHISASGESSNNVTELLAHGANIEAINHAGNTPLHVAVYRSTENVLELLNWGANINHTHTINYSKLKIAIASKLKAAEFINILYHNEQVNDLDKYKNNNQITALLPRLEVLIRKNGIPSHLLNENNIPEFIRSQVTELVNKLKLTDQKIQDAIEPHLAIILNNAYPDKFSSKFPYSQVIKYQDQPSDMAICKHLLNSYKEMPHFKPREFFNYMLTPANHKKIIELFIPSYKEANLMMSSINELLVLPTEQAVLFNNFKSKFFSPLTKDIYQNYIDETISNLEMDNCNKAQDIEQLQAIIKIMHKKITILEGTKSLIPFTKQFTKRASKQSEGYVEFIELERKSVKDKLQERGM